MSDTRVGGGGALEARLIEAPLPWDSLYFQTPEIDEHGSFGSIAVVRGAIVAWRPHGNFKHGNNCLYVTTLVCIHGVLIDVIGASSDVDFKVGHGRYYPR